MKELLRLPVTCNKDCGGGCPLIAEIRDGRLLRLLDNPLKPPAMRGCVRGYQMARTVYHPRRLRAPLLRSGPRGSGRYREVGWKEALRVVAERLERIRAAGDPQAVMRLGGSGSPRGALHNTDLLTKRFLSLFGGFTDLSGSYSAGAELFVNPYLFGPAHAGSAGIDAATLRHSRLILLWGANPADTRFGAELCTRIREQRRRGTPVITIDPRCSRTARSLSDQWIAVRPGSDTALMAAILYVLLEEELVDRVFVREHSLGFEALERYVLGRDDGEAKTPSWAGEICGTGRDVILRLARLYGKSRPAALIPGLSIQRTIGGEEAIRMAVALQTATGNVGVPGGSSGSSAWGRLPDPRCGRMTVPPGGPRPEVPEYRWADAILEGRSGGYPGDIRALYNVGGNYLATGSDVRKNIRAFAKVDFSVCHDCFLTPTAAHCDVVLPVTTFLEREDIVFPESNHLLYSHKAIEPVGQSRNDYDIFCGLADLLGFGREYSLGRSAGEWLECFLEESEIPDADEFRRTGIYSGPEQERCGLSEFAADPEGFPLSTPSGKIEIASAGYARLGFPAFPTWRGFRTGEEYPLYLITPHARYRTNSQHANDPWFVERETQLLWMHPRDAAARGIPEGSRVEAASPQGKLRVTVRVTEEIMPGVVCLLAGMWPEIGGDGVDTAGSANILTSTLPTQPSQSSRTHSVAVDVRPA
ncbi:MAG: molybdopterin-dependent oxidoreductase [Spirochaetales bacterium]|nr:molybdopterin-dependent oxidoreductase [Spirochaetales bacterium]